MSKLKEQLLERAKKMLQDADSGTTDCKNYNNGFIDGIEFVFNRNWSYSSIKVLDVEVPVWYNKKHMYNHLINNRYSQEIANELAELWEKDMQGSFRKGFELGYRYSTGEPIDASVKIRQPLKDEKP